MSIFIVRIHRLARHEFENGYRWYAKRSRVVAERFRDAVNEALDRIEANPTLVPADENNERWVNVRRFPYLLYYVVFATGVAVVFAIAHDKRKPRYWRRRRHRP